MRLLPRRLLRAFVVLAALIAIALPHAAAVRKKPAPKKTARALEHKPLAKQARALRVTERRRRAKARRVFSPWRVPSFADSAVGDRFEGDDPDAREAAIEALGRWNGTVVVSEANTGRVLTIVNQKLALQGAYQPCSTVKIPVALAALHELVIDRKDLVRVGRRTKLDMTKALAVSNNRYFAKLGDELGFERVSSYAKMFGLGEKAGLGIEGEQPGSLPSETPASGMGMMTSFGDGIRLTALELSALMGAVANGGTLYYLQYPKGEVDPDSFMPEVKRKLDIANEIPEIMPGMMGAVDYGTARRIGKAHEEPIYGKTGTCTDTRTPTHLGWFSSFSKIDDENIVVTVLLTGGRGVGGGTAAGIAGDVYRRMAAAVDEDAAPR